MKTLGVIGCHGLLGQNLVVKASEQFRVIGMDLQTATFLSLPNFTYLSGSLLEKTALEYLRPYEPDYLVNCAAYTAVDRAETEKELCWRLNAEGPRNLAALARLLQIPLVHISTDYLFDGMDGPYTIDARPHPLSVYGKSKLAGENELRGSGADYAIIRTMVLYGNGMRLKTDFVRWVIESLRARTPIRVVNDQYGNTTWAPELVRAIMRVLETDTHGIFHAGSRDIINRYDFARKIAAAFQLDDHYIQPVKTKEFNQAAPRPLQSGLRVESTEQRLQMRFLTTDQALAGYAKEIPYTHRMN